MICNVCSDRIKSDVNLICYFCNFVVCVSCQIEFKGEPKKRLFNYAGSIVCGNCYTSIKYK